MAKVYGIWYADYSNSYVGGGVYTNRDDAAAVARESGGDIEEFEIDPPLSETATKLRRPNESFFWVGMDRDGNEAQAREEYFAKEPPSERADVRVNADGKAQRFNSHTWAKDEKHAIKIVNDRRRQWIAQGERHCKRVQKSDGYDHGWRRALP